MGSPSASALRHRLVLAVVRSGVLSQLARVLTACPAGARQAWDSRLNDWCELSGHVADLVSSLACFAKEVEASSGGGKASGSGGGAGAGATGNHANGPGGSSAVSLAAELLAALQRSSVLEHISRAVLQLTAQHQAVQRHKVRNGSAQQQAGSAQQQAGSGAAAAAAAMAAVGPAAEEDEAAAERSAALAVMAAFDAEEAAASMVSRLLDTWNGVMVDYRVLMQQLYGGGGGSPQAGDLQLAQALRVGPATHYLMAAAVAAAVAAAEVNTAASLRRVCAADPSFVPSSSTTSGGSGGGGPAAAGTAAQAAGTATGAAAGKGVQAPPEAPAAASGSQQALLLAAAGRVQLHGLPPGLLPPPLVSLYEPGNYEANAGRSPAAASEVAVLNAECVLNVITWWHIGWAADGRLWRPPLGRRALTALALQAAEAGLQRWRSYQDLYPPLNPPASAPAEVQARGASGAGGGAGSSTGAAIGAPGAAKEAKRQPAKPLTQKQLRQQAAAAATSAKQQAAAAAKQAAAAAAEAKRERQRQEVAKAVATARRESRLRAWLPGGFAPEMRFRLVLGSFEFVCSTHSLEVCEDPAPLRRMAQGEQQRYLELLRRQEVAAESEAAAAAAAAAAGGAATSSASSTAASAVAVAAPQQVAEGAAAWAPPAPATATVTATATGSATLRARPAEVALPERCWHVVVGAIRALAGDAERHMWPAGTTAGHVQELLQQVLSGAEEDSRAALAARLLVVEAEAANPPAAASHSSKDTGGGDKGGGSSSSSSSSGSSSSQQPQRLLPSCTEAAAATATTAAAAASGIASAAGGNDTSSAPDALKPAAAHQQQPQAQAPVPPQQRPSHDGDDDEQWLSGAAAALVAAKRAGLYRGLSLGLLPSLEALLRGIARECAAVEDWGDAASLQAISLVNAVLAHLLDLDAVEHMVLEAAPRRQAAAFIVSAAKASCAATRAVINTFWGEVRRACQPGKGKAYVKSSAPARLGPCAELNVPLRLLGTLRAAGTLCGGSSGSGSGNQAAAAGMEEEQQEQQQQQQQRWRRRPGRAELVSLLAATWLPALAGNVRAALELKAGADPLTAERTAPMLAALVLPHLRWVPALAMTMAEAGRRGEWQTALEWHLLLVTDAPLLIAVISTAHGVLPPGSEEEGVVVTAAQALWAVHPTCMSTCPQQTALTGSLALVGPGPLAAPWAPAEEAAAGRTAVLAALRAGHGWEPPPESPESEDGSSGSGGAAAAPYWEAPPAEHLDLLLAPSMARSRLGLCERAGCRNLRGDSESGVARPHGARGMWVCSQACAAEQECFLAAVDKYCKM
ncbi:hypothetical protein HYH02_004799 [Chlamydomonas schloesseri]|uniref:MYND-type domain-containing protein n=1 Tax=Chlamydomonas schloesseri TaxID=2026947 RepID=A0A836B7V9_9CHLO|nr:hypothetical protein HYH02_004799 [Chlamydomonas schloesseri]|eukprot:KAG2450292.1 hypothetical protein HYH02_004799 [Chlamydomonas schloesseri]